LESCVVHVILLVVANGFTARAAPQGAISVELRLILPRHGRPHNGQGVPAGPQRAGVARGIPLQIGELRLVKFREIRSTASASFSCARIALHAHTIQKMVTATPHKTTPSRHPSTFVLPPSSLPAQGVPPFHRQSSDAVSHSQRVAPFGGLTVRIFLPARS